MTTTTENPVIAVRERGVSLPELLVVIAILALGVMISVPLISGRVQLVRCRVEADELAVSLRAARMVAVSTANPVVVTVLDDTVVSHPLFEDPKNTYYWTDTSGNVQHHKLSAGALIQPGSTATIAFQPNGSLSGPVSVTIETKLAGGESELWRVEASMSGIPVARRHYVLPPH